jgi:hypothetical protein
MMQLWGPLLGMVREGSRAVPAVKYALGVVGLFAAAAIGRSLFEGSLLLAAGGAALMLVLMILLLVFARASLGKSVFGPAAHVLVWFVILFSITVSVTLFSSVFFAWPIDLRRLLDADVAVNGGDCSGESIVATDAAHVVSTRKLTEPDYSAFRFLSDHKSLDLTAWTPVPDHLRSMPISPGTLTRTLRLTKTRPVAEIAFPLSTTGLEPGICVLGDRPYRVEILDAEPTGTKQGVQRSYQLVMGIQEIRPDDEFELVYRVTYWNAFEFSDNSFFAMRVRVPVERLSLAVTFPANRPVQAVKTWRQPYESDEKVPLEGVEGAQMDARAGLSLALSIELPVVGDAYVVDWDW